MKVWTNLIPGLPMCQILTLNKATPSIVKPVGRSMCRKDGKSLLNMGSWGHMGSGLDMGHS